MPDYYSQPVGRLYFADYYDFDGHGIFDSTATFAEYVYANKQIAYDLFSYGDFDDDPKFAETAKDEWDFVGLADNDKGELVAVFEITLDGETTTVQTSDSFEYTLIEVGTWVSLPR